MEKRTILALALVALVLVLTPKLFPGNRGGPSTTPADSNAVLASAPVPAETQKQAASSNVIARAPEQSGTPAERTDTSAVVRSVAVSDSLATFELTNEGAAISRVTLSGYHGLSSGRQKSAVELSTGKSPLLSYRVVTGRDTIDLRKTVFSVQQPSGATGGVVTFSANVRGTSIGIEYRVQADSFRARVKGSISAGDSLGSPMYLLVDLPQTLQSFEADTVDDQRHLAFAYLPGNSDAKSLPFGKLDPGERSVAKGPLTWVVTKSKYFLLGVLAPEKDSSFAEFSAIGGPRSSRIATQAQGTIVVKLAAGNFAFDVYAGPQQWRRLSAIGRDFQNSNPYGGFLQPVVQPFATIVMKILLWMRENLKISYGWVLVIFGIAVRLVLWPLNQKGMRASMKMQRIQPELNEIQKRYKNDPQKMQSEMMRVYKEHDMSPFSTFAGCLPLFLPLPILFALFFVFQNTIEFRGVPFLWFQDISQKDPYYIVPMTMGVSMFVLSWIGMRNTPPNPQTKAMTYIFPVMMTVLFANFPAGLNMYYTIQNLAALPQQWFISNERARNQAVGKAQT